MTARATLPSWAPWIDAPAPPPPARDPETPAEMRDRLLSEAHAAWEALNQEFMS